MPVSFRSGRKKLVNLQTSHIRQPDQGRLIITDNVSNELVETVRAYFSNLDPARMIRPVFLNKRLPRNTMRKTIQHQRPVSDERDHPICHAQVILDHVSLRHSLSLPHRLVKIGEADLPAVNLDNLHRLLQRNPRLVTVHDLAMLLSE